jgi:hypothetical protein
MNILFTSIANFLTLESEECLNVWRSEHHIVEQMRIERMSSYLHFDPASTLALIDVIVCMADTDMIAYSSDRYFAALDFPLQQALKLAKDVRDLPDACTMRDGRKWRSIPFVIFCDQIDRVTALSIQKQSHAHLYPAEDPLTRLTKIQWLVDEYQDRVLDEYRHFGILVRFEKGRAQIRPALRLKGNRVESDYYHAHGDRRNNEGWVTVKRDNQGLREDVERLQMLLETGAGEREMHKFFEEHPSILMEARMGIPISHRPRFSRPKDQTPDFSISPILGPYDGNAVELLELKGPGERTLKKGLHGGFSGKVKDAVDQVRDYDRYLRDAVNKEVLRRDLGYIPDDSRLAVLIGRAPASGPEMEKWQRRQGELDVKIVTYDEILAIQTKQLESPYSIRSGTPDYPVKIKTKKAR